MNKTKLIFLDIDGTLIRDDKTISDFTRKTLLHIHEQGVVIIFISARPIQSIIGICKSLTIPINVVGYNGAFVQLDFLPAMHKVLNKDYTMPIELVKLCYKIVFPNGLNDVISFNLYSPKQWFSNTINYWTQREIDNTGIYPEKQFIGEQFMAEKLKDFKTLKILIRSEPEHLKPIADLIIQSNIVNSLSVHFPKDNLIEITPKATSKGEVVKIIANHETVNRENVLAFGDGSNDLEMLSVATHSYAMENASDCLKRIAKYKTQSNNDDGVAHALVSYFGLDKD